MSLREIWRPIPGYEEYYSASSRGRIRSESRTVRVNGGNFLRRLPERVLRPWPNADGYLQVELRRDGIRATYLVHRLVLLAFVGPPAPGEETLHVDGDPGNNVLSNLRWGTRSDNERDKVAHGTHQQAIKTHCPRGHLLAEPNLVPSSLRRGERSCLACKRTTSLRRKVDDRQAVSDDYYRAIMAGRGGGGK